MNRTQPLTAPHPRTLSAIHAAIDELANQVWYRRCFLAVRDGIGSGAISIVEDAPPEV